MPGFFKSIGNFLTGTPEKKENVSTLRPEQEDLYRQLTQAGQRPGAGGAFGQSADYYRGLLSDQNPDIDAFNAPAMRQFNEDIIPALSEQFAGFGSGGLSSSGFRNAAVNAGTDLSERLGAIRAQLRSQGAAGLAGIGQAGLGNFSQNMTTQQGSPGLLGNLSSGIGTGIGQAIGPSIGKGLGSMFGGNSGFGKTSPYGNLNDMSDSVTKAAGWS